MKHLFLLMILILVLYGCATIIAATQDNLFASMDVIAGKICLLSEHDRIPIREAFLSRYGIDTSPLCPHLQRAS